MNVLLTSVGRRSYLVDYFKDAVYPHGRVIVANSESITSGMIAADKSYTVPQVNLPEYLPMILDICRKENVTLALSLFDIDLPYLAKARSEFIKAGIQLVISEPWVVEIANDKWKTYDFLKKQGILTPTTFLSINEVYSAIKSGKVNYPFIIKPRWGMGSLSVHYANNEGELSFFYQYALNKIEKNYLKILSYEDLSNSVIIQEAIIGYEYGMDIFNSLDGKYLQTVSKIKLAMRSGETDIARILDDPQFNDLGEQLARTFKHRGSIDVDVIKDRKGELFVIDINARFGGGYPFSHLAGANFPAALVAMAKGDEPVLGTLENGCTGLKSISIVKALT